MSNFRDFVLFFDNKQEYNSSMSKYESLWKYLKFHDTKTIKLSFDEIHKILGFDIDHSFLTYKKELIQFGYEVGKISLKEKHITFTKL